MGTRTPASFQTEARDVLGRLTSASAALFADLGRQPQRPADVTRSLGLDKKLGWQVYRIATATDPMLAGPHLLTPASVRRLLTAAESAGIELQIRQRLSAAFDECERLIQRHATDRASFALMAAASADADEIDAISLADRRTAFRAQSHILGVTALSTFKTFFFHPGEGRGGLGHVMSLRGITELIPLQPQLCWPVSWARASASNDDTSPGSGIFRPLPGCETSSGLSLAEDFCSTPLPRVEHRQEPDGSVRSELMLEGVGRTHATTVVTGYFAPGELATRRNESNRAINANLEIRAPCELCQLDVLVHKGLGWPGAFEAEVFGDHFAPQASTHARERDRLRVHCDPVRGEATHVTMARPPVPRYQQLLDWACSNLGWDLGEFEATRAVIEYPIMPSTLRLSMKLD